VSLCVRSACPQIQVLHGGGSLCASKNDKSNESNTLFYSYMNVDDKQNIVMPPSSWWRLWALRSTSRTWGHRLLPMGSAFSCIFKVDLYWWQSVPHIPLHWTQHCHGTMLCRDDDAKFTPTPPPPETAFFTDKLTHIKHQIWMALASCCSRKVE
jgi:hypothetical protein